jgi:hypothetical protein
VLVTFGVRVGSDPEKGSGNFDGGGGFLGIGTVTLDTSHFAEGA